MTISASGVARVSYVGNGATTAFTTPVFISNSDIVATLVLDSTGVETVQVLTTNYTLSGGNGATGTLTMLVAPATGTTLVIYTNPTLSQDVDLVNGDPLNVDTQIERPLDRLTLITRRSRDLAERALRLPEGDTSGTNMVLAAAVTRASKYLFFDAAGVPSYQAGTTSIVYGASTLLKSVTNVSAAGAQTLPAAGVAGGFISRSGMTANVTDTLPSAASVTALIPGYAVGTVVEFEIANESALYSITIGGGSGWQGYGIMTASTTIQPLSSGRFIGIVASGSVINVHSMPLANEASLTTVASATTPNIFATNIAETISYTGTATATGFATAPKAGITRTLICTTGGCVFTAGANLLIDGVASGTSVTMVSNGIVRVVAISTTQFKLDIVGNGRSCASGYTRVGPNLCMKTTAITLTTNLVSGVTALTNPDTNSKAIIVWINAQCWGASAIADRFSNIDYYGDTTGTTSQGRVAAAAREFGATINQLASTTNVVTIAKASGYSLRGAYDAGTASLGYYEVRGYLD